MHLTKFTDYSLRVLLFASSNAPNLSSIRQVADAYNIPETHLKKVVHVLSQGGYIESIRGKGGGFRLASPPETIKLGDVVRYTEKDFVIVECFDPETDHCCISSVCSLRFVLQDALNSFFSVLDNYTLAELAAPRDALRNLLALQTPSSLDNQH